MSCTTGCIWPGEYFITKARATVKIGTDFKETVSSQNKLVKNELSFLNGSLSSSKNLLQKSSTLPDSRERGVMLAQHHN